MMNDSENKKGPEKEERVKTLLAQHLGLEPEDIEDDDSLVNDLHMRPSDISDLIESLNSEGIDTSHLEITEVETVQELIESLNLEEP